MTKKQERHIVASIGTLLFLAIVFLLLWLIKMHAYQPEQEEGVVIAFEEIEEQEEPAGAAAAAYAEESSEAAPAAPASPAPEVATSPTPAAPPEHILSEEENLSLERARKKEEREAAERARKQKEAEFIAQTNALGSKLFGQTKGTNTNDDGTSQDAGQKTNPAGHSSIGVRDSRISGLDGRNTRDGKLPTPTYEYQHYGVVVVKIRIDKEGNVISAVNATGTNTSDQKMIQSVINAIKTTKWTAGEGVSEGTIEYTFKLN